MKHLRVVVVIALLVSAASVVRAQPLAGTVKGVIKVGAGNLGDGKTVTCVDTNSPHPTSTVPSNGVPGSGTYQCDGVDNGTYQLSVDGNQADPSGTCAAVNNNTVTCNATVGGTCGNPTVSFTTAMLPTTLASCLAMRKGKRRARRRPTVARSRSRLAAALLAVLGSSGLASSARAELCDGKKYNPTLIAYAEAWREGSQLKIDGLKGLIADGFERTHGAQLKSVPQSAGDAFDRVSAIIRSMRAHGGVTPEKLVVTAGDCGVDTGSTATATVKWSLGSTPKEKGVSTLTFDMTSNPPKLLKEAVRE